MTSTNENREHITTLEAEHRSGLSRNYLALLLRRGKLEGFRPARDWFVYTDSLEQFLATQRKSGPRGPRKPPSEADTGDSNYANHQSQEG